MHQSGQLRAHSMHTVHASWSRAMTPRARGTGVSLTSGYMTVFRCLDGRKMVLNIVDRVTHMPFHGPSPGHGLVLNQITTLRIAVTAMLARARGTSTFQASGWSWSSRNRGNVQRNHSMTKTSTKDLATSTIGPSTVARSPLSPGKW